MLARLQTLLKRQPAASKNLQLLDLDQLKVRVITEI